MPAIEDGALPPPLPQPQGWFEVACCSGVVLALVALLVVVALVR